MHLGWRAFGSVSLTLITFAVLRLFNGPFDVNENDQTLLLAWFLVVVSMIATRKQHVPTLSVVLMMVSATLLMETEDRALLLISVIGLSLNIALTLPKKDRAGVIMLSTIPILIASDLAPVEDRATLLFFVLMVIFVLIKSASSWLERTFLVASFVLTVGIGLIVASSSQYGRNEPPLSSKVTVVVLTVFENDRATETIRWASSLNLPLIVDKAHLMRDTEIDMQMLGWHKSCEYLKDDPTRGLGYSLRWKTLLNNLPNMVSTEWVLLLEDDAEPIARKTLLRQLRSAVRSPQYDLVWLDTRNFWSDVLPLPAIYVGTAATLLHVNSMKAIEDCFRLNEEYCSSPFNILAGADNFLSVCCKQGHVRCHSRPYIRERGVSSTLRKSLPK